MAICYSSELPRLAVHWVRRDKKKITLLHFSLLFSLLKKKKLSFFSLLSLFSLPKVSSSQNFLSSSLIFSLILAPPSSLSTKTNRLVEVVGVVVHGCGGSCRGCGCGGSRCGLSGGLSWVDQPMVVGLVGCHGLFCWMVVMCCYFFWVVW